jgi:hypothetical protein
MPWGRLVLLVLPAPAPPPASCMPLLARAPDGVCGARWLSPPMPARPPATEACTAPALLPGPPAALRAPAGLLLLALLALPGEAPGKGSDAGTCALAMKGCFSRRVALARSRATLVEMVATARAPSAESHARSGATLQP